jgi:hypothetical protein
MSDVHRQASLGIPGVTECVGCLTPIPADLFKVAAMARLIRITQGKHLLTLRKWSLALDYHAGMIAGKSSKSRKCPSLWNISLRKSIDV